MPAGRSVPSISVEAGTVCVCVSGAHRPSYGLPICQLEVCMGSLIKKRRKKMSKHKYRKRLKANRHKRKK